ncbi:hypothetical protein Btru_046878 [Bulinus truncatus]|nr:hypothetical protein Btru_046878 [Bulinus truncatus]
MVYPFIADSVCSCESVREDATDLCLGCTLEVVYVRLKSLGAFTTDKYHYISPGFGQRSGNISCKVLFIAAHDLDIVNVTILESNLEPRGNYNACREKVTFYDGSSTVDPMLENSAGKETPTYESTGNTILMTFNIHSNKSRVFKGFKLQYFSLDKVRGFEAYKSSKSINLVDYNTNVDQTFVDYNTNVDQTFVDYNTNVDQTFVDYNTNVDQTFVDYNTNVDQTFVDYNTNVDQTFVDYNTNIDQTFARPNVDNDISRSADLGVTTMNLLDQTDQMVAAHKQKVSNGHHKLEKSSNGSELQIVPNGHKTLGAASRWRFEAR